MQKQDYERAALIVKEGMKYYCDIECCFLDGKTGRQSSAMKSW